MSYCKYYDEAEIERDFPLEKCATCENNKQDAEDGFYACRLMINHVNQMVKRGENKCV